MSFVFWHMVIGFAAKDFKIRNVWDCAIPELQWSSPLIRTSGSSIVDMYCSIHCSLPKTKAKACMMKHASAFFHNRMVKMLVSLILLWKIGNRVFMLYPCFVQYVLQIIVHIFTTTIQMQAFNGLSSLEFSPSLIVLEGLLELVFGFHVDDNCNF